MAVKTMEELQTPAGILLLVAGVDFEDTAVLPVVLAILRKRKTS